jgi:hypothetical protein
MREREQTMRNYRNHILCVVSEVQGQGADDTGSTEPMEPTTPSEEPTTPDSAPDEPQGQDTEKNEPAEQVEDKTADINHIIEKRLNRQREKLEAEFQVKLEETVADIKKQHEERDNKAADLMYENKVLTVAMEQGVNPKLLRKVDRNADLEEFAQELKKFTRPQAVGTIDISNSKQQKQATNIDKIVNRLIEGDND